MIEQLKRVKSVGPPWTESEACLGRFDLFDLERIQPLDFQSAWSYNVLMDSGIFSVLIYSFLAGAATLAGAVFVLKNKSLDQKKTIYLISFSAGVLLSLALVDIIPEASELNPSGYFYAALVSFTVLYFLEQRIMMHSCAEDKCEHHHFEKGKGLMGLWGIFLHSMVDGALIGVGFEVSPVLGLTTTLAVLIHKIPDGVSVTSIMLHSGFTRKDIQKGAFLVAMATPLGAIVSYLLLSQVSEGILGLALGLSAGTFLYISASDLIPETHNKFSPWNSLYVILGILTIVSFKLFL